MGKNEKNPNELCTVLRVVRIAQDLSTREVAEKMNVRTSYITDVERGDRSPSIATLDKYCEALNISINNVFLWRDELKAEKYSFRRLLMKILSFIESLDDLQHKEELKIQEFKQEKALLNQNY